jgi:DNA-binding transcriptional LysR family regulator
VSRDLAAGRLDGAIDVVRATGPELRQEPLARDTLCVLSRKRRALDPARYLAAQHVSVSSRPSGPSLEDLALSQLGVSRSILVRCQRYEAACRIVAESSLLLTAPRLTTREIAARLGLVLLPVPFALPPVELRLYWHRQAEDDPRSRWIRTLILSAGAQAGWKGRFSSL